MEPPPFVTREEWNAESSKAKKPLIEPEYIALGWTGTDACKSKEECMKRVKEIQDTNMKEDGLPDIKYNFLVGGDNSVYEGRGWHVATDVSTEGKKHSNMDGKSIFIAFIGPKGSIPTPRMLAALLGLNTIGLSKKFISKEIEMYRLDSTDVEEEE